jgi:hypothetical protein
MVLATTGVMGGEPVLVAGIHVAFPVITDFDGMRLGFDKVSTGEEFDSVGRDGIASLAVFATEAVNVLEGEGVCAGGDAIGECFGLVGCHFFDGGHDGSACGFVFEVDGGFFAVLVDFEVDFDVLAGGS